ncbi:MAG TPA: BON domain-containing protein [Candidatus Angelobacter sp.]|nr:BON domain-containing protein [Candidatus Angelobacter sp.]
MKKSFYLLSLGLAMSAAAIAQTSSQTQTPPVNSTTPSTQIGSGAQTKSGTPAPTSTTSPTGQVNPTGTAQAPADSQVPSAGASGGVAGAASSSASQSPSSQTIEAGGVGALSDSDLESQIQNALSKEPTLTGDSAHATVSGDTIELAGKVNTSKEKLTAARIVQSYAGNKKVVNHLTVGGNAGKSSDETRDSNAQSNTTNPTNNPEPNKGTPPSASKPPLV